MASVDTARTKLGAHRFDWWSGVCVLKCLGCSLLLMYPKITFSLSYLTIIWLQKQRLHLTVCMQCPDCSWWIQIGPSTSGLPYSVDEQQFLREFFYLPWLLRPMCLCSLNSSNIPGTWVINSWCLNHVSLFHSCQRLPLTESACLSWSELSWDANTLSQFVVQLLGD